MPALDLPPGDDKDHRPVIRLSDAWMNTEHNAWEAACVMCGALAFRRLKHLHWNHYPTGETTWP
jgi:hypothetical protein